VKLCHINLSGPFFKHIVKWWGYPTVKILRGYV